MKLFLMVAAIITMVVADEFYSSKYDDFDVQPLLENDRILQGYTNCFLEKGPCTPDAKDFKKVIPEALETSCGRCSPKQRQLIRQVVKAVMDKHPDAWTELENRFDKDKKYREAFNRFLHEEEGKK